MYPAIKIGYIDGVSFTTLISIFLIHVGLFRSMVTFLGIFPGGLPMQFGRLMFFIYLSLLLFFNFFLLEIMIEQSQETT